MRAAARGLGLVIAVVALCQCRAPQASEASPAPAAVPAKPLKRRPLPPGLQLGVGLAHIHRRGQGYGSKRSKAELKRIRAMGATAVALTPFFYQKKINSPWLRTGDVDPTLTSEDLRRDIEAAHALGMVVLVKPHVWSSDFWKSSRWHGDIAMEGDADWARWFERYEAGTLELARVAEAAGAEGFCIGTELMGTTLPKPERWRALIRKVRAVFSGYLTYAAHWDGEWDRVSFWGDLDYIGVNAYYPVKAGDTSKVAEVAAGAQRWVRKLQAFSKAEGRPVLITEIGYTHHPGTCEKPWLYGDDGRPVEFGPQAECYDGVLQALRGAPEITGLFLWKWFTAYGADSYESDAFSPRGKPAEQVIARHFSAWVKREAKR